MPKKRATYRLDERLIAAMKSMAKDRRWDVTTVVEVAIENLMKAGGYLDEKGNLTDKVDPSFLESPEENA